MVLWIYFSYFFFPMSYAEIFSSWFKVIFFFRMGTFPGFSCDFKAKDQVSFCWSFSMYFVSLGTILSCSILCPFRSGITENTSSFFLVESSFFSRAPWCWNPVTFEMDLVTIKWCKEIQKVVLWSVACINHNTGVLPDSNAPSIESINIREWWKGIIMA